MGTTVSTPQYSDPQIQGIIQASAIERTQSISGATTINPTNQPIYSIQPLKVGLVKSFTVSITATISNTGTTAITPTDFGASNLLYNIQFTDPQNNQRINCPGFFISLLNSIRHRQLYQTALVQTATDVNSVMNYGSNINVQSMTPSIAAGGTGTVTFNWEIPVCYSDRDYRGIINMAVLNAVSFLQLTFPSPAQLAAVGTADSTFAVYKGASAANVVSITSATINVYQKYMDQIPTNPQTNLPFLPPIAASTQYLLQSVNNSGGMAANQQFNMPYANLRQFISSIIVFNNGTTTNGGRGNGTDIVNIGLQTANQSYVFQLSPAQVAIRMRKVLFCDPPPGTYYLSFRDKPFSTANYGTLQLGVVPAVIGANPPYILNFSEMFANIATVQNAGSLSSS